MPFWPLFKRKPALLTAEELRDKLIMTASTGSGRKLRKLCNDYKSQVAESLDVISKVPDGMPNDDGSVDRYVQNVIAVAQCLAQECGAPELLNKLTGTSDNPLTEWERWFNELPARMEQLEHETLITEVQSFIERCETLRGSPVRLQEAIMHGRLGELLFHSGRVSECVAPFRAAGELCVELDDGQGQITYLGNLLEAHCYLDDGLAIPTAQKLLSVQETYGVDTTVIAHRLKLLTQGVPLCRIVCAHEGNVFEMEELSSVGDGKFQFHFYRNRLQLQKATTLTSQGNQLAASGQFADAMEKYAEASEIDPFDPDPVYQRGMCLLELGAYGSARETFEEVERLAPGWFRCRTDRWLADGLDKGTISNDEFAVLRYLDDGQLEQKEAAKLAQQAVDRFPDFAPLWLYLGDNCKDDPKAIEAYRRGLELVEEPDLESRLLCALAGRLPQDSAERTELVERALHLEGSLVVVATAQLMGLK